VRIGSAGKTFSLTGWKVGYVTAAPNLLDPIAKAHQFTTFTTPAHLQQAVAFGLAKDDAYYASLSAALAVKRDRFAAGLARLGFAVAPCEGTYFLTADAAPLRINSDDVALCKAMTVDARVTAVPVSVFYTGDAPRTFVRFCFSKRDEILDEALDRLGKWLGRLATPSCWKSPAAPSSSRAIPAQSPSSMRPERRASRSATSTSRCSRAPP
jgi:aspartate/methionine/tyrosine aminotransferase